METTGRIQNVAQKKTSTGKDIYSIKLGDKFYSGFGITTWKAGDTVRVEFDVNGIYNNIKVVNPFEEPDRSVISMKDESLETIANSMGDLYALIEKYSFAKVEQSAINHKVIAEKLDRIIALLEQKV